jgi:transcriptional regulator with XRE-family HTH domain
MIDIKQEKLGTVARKVRISLRLTQQQLAGMAGISEEAVSLFENNLPVYLDARRRVIKVLWAIKANRYTSICHD